MSGAGAINPTTTTYGPHGKYLAVVKRPASILSVSLNLLLQSVLLTFSHTCTEKSRLVRYISVFE